MELVAAGAAAEIREVPPLLYLHGLLIGILLLPSHLEAVVDQCHRHQRHLEGEVDQRHRHNQYNRHNQWHHHTKWHHHSHSRLQQRHVGAGEEL